MLPIVRQTNLNPYIPISVDSSHHYTRHVIVVIGVIMLAAIQVHSYMSPYRKLTFFLHSLNQSYS